MTDDNVLTFDPSKRKPRKIEQVLPWPPSEGLIKEMEQGTVTEANFAVPVVICKKGKSQDEVMRDLENRRKL